MANMYCRFCAELKPAEKVLDLDKDAKKCKEIVVKLTFLNAIYIDVSSSDSLPKTVCLDCYNSLNTAYDFLDKVKRAQDLIISLFPKNDEKALEGLDFSDDDRLENLFCENDDENNPHETKEEPEASVEVKIEPKEDETGLETLQYCPEGLNVQDILDAALLKGSLTQVSPKDVVPRKIQCWKEYPWICAHCNIEFPHINMLRSHSKIVHNRCAGFSCIDCKDKSNEFNMFILHVKMHQKNLRNLCHRCDAIVDPEDLETHMKEHLISRHCCPTCGDIFEEESSLREHQDSLKKKRKPRRKRGTPITEQDRTCQICNKVYKNLNSLRDHVKRHRSDRKRNYTCDRCGKMFYNKGTLTSHVMSHDEVRPHVCRICNKSFMFPNLLRRHVDMHSGVKPFSCEVCGRCFRLKYQLNAHKIIHTDSLPHVCQYCNKAFRFKQILRNHERQHTGAKPYSCSQCFLEFSNWSNYNKHMKRRHNIDTSKKKITPDGVFPVNPVTGQLVHLEVHDMEEWKSKVMIPGKRGKKKVIMEENFNT